MPTVIFHYTNGPGKKQEKKGGFPSPSCGKFLSARRRAGLPSPQKKPPSVGEGGEPGVQLNLRMHLVGHFSAQRPQPVHLSWSMRARLSVTVMAPAGQLRWHRPQPMQPAEQIFRV